MRLTLLSNSTTVEGQESRILRDLNEPLVDHAEGQLFLNNAFKIIMEEVLCKGTDIKQKVSWCLKSHRCAVYREYSAECITPGFFWQVCEWKEPEELSLLLDLELRATGEPRERLLQRVKDVAKYSIKTSKAASTVHWACL